MKKSNVLVLGADGFIGSNLIRSLLTDGKYSIRAFDLFKDGQSRNLDDLRDKIEIFPGNFLNHEDIRRAVEHMDYVFHFVSLTTPGSSMNDPLIDIDTNVKGTIVLLDECAKASVKKIIYSSTGGAIYGDQGLDRYREDDNTNPVSPYAISKLTIEKYLEYFRINKGLDYLILRYANPYGPGQNIVGSQGIIPIFLNLIRQGKPITIYGDGENVRDYIYIDDLIGITKLLFSGKTKHRIYNVGSGKGESVNDVVGIIKSIVGEEVAIEVKPDRLIDVRSTVLDTRRSLEETLYEENLNLSQGIRKTWDWINKIR